MKVSNGICKSGIITKFTTETGLKCIFVDINFKQEEKNKKTLKLVLLFFLKILKMKN